MSKPIVDKIWETPYRVKIWCDTEQRYNGSSGATWTIAYILDNPQTDLLDMNGNPLELDRDFYKDQLIDAVLIYDRIAISKENVPKFLGRELIFE